MTWEINHMREVNIWEINHMKKVYDMRDWSYERGYWYERLIIWESFMIWEINYMREVNDMRD